MNILTFTLMSQGTETVDVDTRKLPGQQFYRVELLAEEAKNLVILHPTSGEPIECRTNRLKGARREASASRVLF